MQEVEEYLYALQQVLVKYENHNAEKSTDLVSKDEPEPTKAEGKRTTRKRQALEVEAETPEPKSARAQWKKASARKTQIPRIQQSA